MDDIISQKLWISGLLFSFPQPFLRGILTHEKERERRGAQVQARALLSGISDIMHRLDMNNVFSCMQCKARLYSLYHDTYRARNKSLQNLAKQDQSRARENS